MFRKSLLIISFFLCLCCQTNSNKNSVIPDCNNNQEINEYEVYSAIVNNVYKDSNQPIVIFEKTLNNKNSFQLAFNQEWLKVIKKDFPNLDESLAEGFNFSNKESYPLERKFKVSMPYKFASEKDFEEIYSDYLKRYEIFKKKFPEAVSSNTSRMISFSKPGFNSAFSQSVVYVQIWNDRASWFFLKRENCQWKVVLENNISVH